MTPTPTLNTALLRPRRLGAFSTWCTAIGREPLADDADTIALYIVRRTDGGLTVSSRRMPTM